MNFKWLIIMMTLLALLTLSAVSAAENATDANLTSVNEAEVTFDEQMWEDNLSDIRVSLPDTAEGDFMVKINDEVIYNEPVREKSFTVPVKLPKEKFLIIATIWPPMDCRNYKVSFFLNNVEIISPKNLKVMKYAPDYDYLKYFPKEVLQHDNQSSLRYSLLFPRSANGDVEVYLDNNLLTKTKVNPPYLDLDYSRFHNLDLGVHTLKIVYSGDTYYSPLTKTHTFEVVQALINIPDPINVTHDDCLSVRVMIQSVVNVYLDSQLIACQMTENNEFILPLEQYLKRNSREITVVVTNSEFTRHKTQKVNVVYDFDIYSQKSFVYGESNVLEVYMPDTLNNNLLTVTINGVRWPFTRPSYMMNNVIELDISALGSGRYTLFISYPGDDRFAPHSRTFDFEVGYAIMYPSFVEFKDGSKVYLNLPKDASDYLNVYINGVLFKSVRVADGHAEIRLDGLAPGRYILDAKYMGKDYDVADISSRILVSPKITVDGYFRVGEKKFIKMEVPKKCRGRMIVDINGKKHTVRIKNGKAVFSLKKLKIGEYDVDVTYIGDDGFKITDYFFVEVVPAKIKIRAKSLNVLYKHKAKYRVKVFGRDAKVIKNGMVKFKIAKRTFKAKTDRRGIAEIKLPALKLKTYKIKVSYKKAKETRKVKVGLVKTHRITKSGSKLKLKATLYKKLRSKTVTFKFMGKKYKSKTNSKGIAQVLVKNPKTAKKLTYTARYAGSTAKQH